MVLAAKTDVKGDWVAYSLSDGIAKVAFRGSKEEAYREVRLSPVPLYLKRRPLKVAR